MPQKGTKRHKALERDFSGMSIQARFNAQSSVGPCLGAFLGLLKGEDSRRDVET